MRTIQVLVLIDRFFLTISLRTMSSRIIRPTSPVSTSILISRKAEMTMPDQFSYLLSREVGNWIVIYKYAIENREKLTSEDERSIE